MDGFAETQPLRIAAVFIIAVASCAGVFLPLSVRRMNLALHLARCVGAGVVTATGFVHMLPPAGECVTAPCYYHTCLRVCR
jgi:hypothetical protein